jgi:replicative DNA helicase
MREGTLRRANFRESYTKVYADEAPNSQWTDIIEMARKLRHTTPKITLELYAQTVFADQQEAHKKVAQMVLPSEFSQKLKARSVTATA